MEQVTIKKHYVDEGEFPDTSRNVITQPRGTSILMTLNFAKQHQLFNVQDYYTEEEATKSSIDVIWWADLKGIIDKTELEF